MDKRAVGEIEQLGFVYESAEKHMTNRGRTTSLRGWRTVRLNMVKEATLSLHFVEHTG